MIALSPLKGVLSITGKTSTARLSVRVCAGWRNIPWQTGARQQRLPCYDPRL